MNGNKEAIMTRRELNRAIFKGTADKVLWQPRLEEWINTNRAKNQLPAPYRDMDDWEIYDYLRCSRRYAGRAGLVQSLNRAGLVVIEERHPSHRVITYRTPVGEITTRYHDLWEGDRLANERIEDFPVKTAKDLRVAIDLVNRQQFRADVKAFEAADRAFGQRGEPTLFLTSSGFTELVKDWCGLLGTYYLLNDEAAVVEEYLEACERRDNRCIDAALQLPCRIFNFGDHATNEFTPPPILKKYLIPRWQRLAARLHKEGRYCHTHWDGHSKLMLPYLRDAQLDAVEALTPEPMGDMTLDEIKAAVGDEIICLDLLPAICFLPNYRTSDLVNYAKRVIDMFAPRLILGISDEISSVGEIEKVAAVTEVVEKVCGLAE